MEAINILEGADVYGEDFARLGSVKRVFSAAPLSTIDAGSVASAEVGNVIASEAAANLAMGKMGFADAATSEATLPGEYEERIGASVSHAGLGSVLGPSDTKYLEVHHGGHFGIGGESLYVPFGAIKFIEDDGSVILQFAGADATGRFREVPRPLDDEDINTPEGESS